MMFIKPRSWYNPWPWGKTGIDEFLHDEYELHYEEMKVTKWYKITN